MYNQLNIEEDDYKFENVVDNYFKNGVMLLKVKYVGDNLGKYNTIKVPFRIFKEDVPI